MTRLWALTLLVACFGGSSDDAKLETIIATPMTETPVAPLKPDCDRMRYALESEVSSAYVAKDRYHNYRKALEMAPAVPAVCRAGWWYLAVARLLDLGFDRALVGFETPEAALVAALQQPDDVGVLERVAQVAALGRDIRLPGDACQRARAIARALSQATATFGDRVVADRGKDSARCVCARAAIAEGNGASASGALDEIADPDRLADFELARAQAAKLSNDRAARIRNARAALVKARRFGHYTRVTEDDRDAIVRLATPLAR